MIVASLARILQLEEGLGIDRGHREAEAFIEAYLDRSICRPVSSAIQGREYPQVVAVPMAAGAGGWAQSRPVPIRPASGSEPREDQVFGERRRAVDSEGGQMRNPQHTALWWQDCGASMTARLSLRM